MTAAHECTNTALNEDDEVQGYFTPIPIPFPDPTSLLPSPAAIPSPSLVWQQRTRQGPSVPLTPPRLGAPPLR
jgi:hypothetical protein